MLPARAFAADTRSFTGTASAVGADVALTNPDVIPLGATIQIAGPVAQGTLNALGMSQGFAAAPYPGNEVTGAPGLINGSAGISAPSYPFIVNSDASSNSAPADRSVAGYRLHAASTDKRTEASGEVGPGGGLMRAVASARVARADSGAVAAHAESVASAVAVPGVVSIARVRAVADVASDPNGEVRPTSSLTVSGLELLGVDVSLHDGRIVLAGQNTPVPANPLLTQLAERGTTVEYLAPVMTKDSVVSAGLRLTSKQVDPSGRTPGTYTISLTLGRAFAQLQTSTFAELPVGLPPVGPSAPPTLPSGATRTTGILPLGGSNVGSPSVGSVPNAEPATAEMSTVASVAAARSPRLVDWLPVYLALALCSLVGLGAGTLVRLLGVRATWRS